MTVLFFAEPFEADIRELQTLSSANLTVFGMTAFVLETRITEDYVPKTVFVMRHRNGVVSWARATSTEFGRIHLLAGSERWFLPGGWVVGIKPEGTETGELYISPIGGFRFFFHSW